ncbi:MAG: hypothetical protein AAF621_04955 [Pseudomonadota bacterium]
MTDLHAQKKILTRATRYLEALLGVLEKENIAEKTIHDQAFEKRINNFIVIFQKVMTLYEEARRHIKEVNNTLSNAKERKQMIKELREKIERFCRSSHADDQ